MPPESYRPYSRLYHEMAEEYPEIYDSALLADYMRLLVAADQAHPTRARWAGYTTKRAIDRLGECGLVTVDGARYSIRGMDKERAARAEKARKAAQASHATGSARGSATSRANGTADADPTVLPRAREVRAIDETSRDETSRDEQYARADDLHRLQALAEVLCSQPYALVNLNGRLGERVRRQLSKHGLAATERAWREAASNVEVQPPELGQVVLGAGDILDPPPRRMSADERRLREREEAKAWMASDG